MTVAYRSEHPEVRAAWGDTQRRWREFHDALDLLRQEYPNHDPVRVQWYGGETVKFGGLSGTDSPGDGWRFAKQQDVWMPDKRTKAGKALAVQLDDLKVNGLGKMPGMPKQAWDDLTLHHHGVTDTPDAIFVIWGCEYESVERNELENGPLVDFDLWERCPLSGYYAAKEALDMDEVT